MDQETVTLALVILTQVALRLMEVAAPTLLATKHVPARSSDRAARSTAIAARPQHIAVSATVILVLAARQVMRSASTVCAGHLRRAITPVSVLNSAVAAAQAATAEALRTIAPRQIVNPSILVLVRLHRE